MTRNWGQLVGKKISLLLAMAILAGCTGFQAEKMAEKIDKSSNPWNQGTVIDTPSAAATTPIGASRPSCSISVPSIIMQNQELRLIISSFGVAKAQVSVNGSEFRDLGTVQGFVSWPSNTFEAGSYSLKFRSLTASKQTVACDPENKVVTIAPVNGGAVVPVIPTPPVSPLPSPTTTLPEVPSTGVGEYTDYEVHVGVGPIVNKGFNSLHKPSTLGTRVIGNHSYFEILYDGVGSGNMGTGQARKKLKFFIPPGTAAIDAGMYLFLCPSDELRGYWKLYSPPLSALSAISTSESGGSHSEDTFRMIAEKKEKPFYLPPTTGNYLVMSSPNDVESPLSQGGYLYSHVQYPCGDFQRLSIRLYVRKDCYERWFNSSAMKWDVNGNPVENAIHVCN